MSKTINNTIVWSKTPCPFCVQAKQLLTRQGIEFEERNISNGDWTKEQLLEAVPNARTVPQIFLEGRLIGGYDQLKLYFENIEKEKNGSN
jgi:glutaredoxin 3